MRLRRHPLPLIAVVILAIALREIPAWMNGAWGNDFGIYLGLTERMLETGELFPAYDGWGTSYQFFPVFYLFSAAVHAVSGADLVWLMPRLAGVLGGLTVLFLYGIGRDLSRSRRFALLAALILAVDPIHIYQTSHPAPMTAGHLFLTASLYLFLRWRRGGSPWPLVACAGLLLLSHHLSTYMFLLSVAGVAFGGRILGRSSDREFRRDLLFLGAVSSAAFAYWGLVATPVVDHVRFVSGLPFPVGVGLFLEALVCSAVLVPRVAARIRGIVHRVAAGRSPRSVFLLAFLLGYGFVAVNVFPRPFGNAFGLDANALLILLPPVLLLSFTASGLVRTIGREPWAVPQGILLVFLASLVFGFVTQSAVIIPYRHLENLSIPVALLAASALMGWSRPRIQVAAERRPRPWRAALPSRILAAAIPILLVGNAATGFAAVNGQLGFDERIPDVSLEMVGWMSDHLEPSGTVAADHRISQLLWARGFNVTSDGSQIVWTEESWRDIVPELCAFRPRVAYVFIDQIDVESGIQSGTNATPVRMTAAMYAKFHLRSGPFDLLHRVESPDLTRWAEVYRVDWGQIAQDKFLPWSHPSC